MASEDTEVKLAHGLYREATVTNSGGFFLEMHRIKLPLSANC